MTHQNKSPLKQTQYDFSSLDLNNIEKSLKYLAACQRSKLLQNENASLLHELEDFIKSYSEFVQKQVQQCFGYVTEFNSGDREEVFRNVQKLASYFEEVYQIQNKYDEFYQRFDIDKKIITEWKRKLIKYSSELTIEMENLRASDNHQELNNKLIIARALRQMDEFLDRSKFEEIYREYQTKLWDGASTNLIKIENAIKNLDFGLVLSEIKHLESVNDPLFAKQVQGSKKMLNDSVTNLLEETQGMARFILLKDHVILEKIQTLVQNLKKIQSSKAILSDYIDKPQRLDECIEKVKKTVSKGLLELVRCIEGLIKSNNFEEIDPQLASFELICETLGNFCDEEIIHKINDLKGVQISVLDNLKKRYLEMEVKEYLINPPKDILDKLEIVSSRKTEYFDALNAIKRIIIFKFREDLRNIQENCTQEANTYLRILETVLKCLPDGIRGPLEVELKSTTENMSQILMKHAEELEDTVGTTDPLKISKFLEKCEQKKMVSSTRIVRDAISKQIKELNLIINNNLLQRNIREALYNLKKLLEYKTTLGDHVGETKQAYIERHDQVLKTFEDAYNSFSRRVDQSPSFAMTEEGTFVAEKEFLCLTDFLCFRKENKGHPIQKDLLPDTVNMKFRELNDRLIKFMEDKQNKYEEGLQNMNTYQLQNVLDAMKKWEALLLRIRAYADMYDGNDISMRALVETFSKVKSYSEMSLNISTKVKNFKDDILNVKLINEDTKRFQNPRDEYYKRLNSKVEIFTKTEDLDGFDLGVNLNLLKQECCDSLARKVSELLYDTLNLLDRLISKGTLTKNDFDTLNMNYNNLVSFEQNIKAFEIGEIKNYKKIEEKLMDHVSNLATSVLSSSEVEYVANTLIKIKFLSDNVSVFKEKIDQIIDETVTDYKIRKGKEGAMAISRLGTILNQDKSGVGPSLVSAHKAFQGYALSLFNTITQKHGIDYVLKNIEGSDLNTSLLKKKYDEFTNMFQALVQKYLKPNVEFEKLILEIKQVAGDLKQKPSKIIWDINITCKVPKLMAYVFAFWTLKNAKHYFEAQSLTDKNNYLFQPHAAQIVSIFRMLGIGDSREELKNNLVQVGTGEGKSVVLAVSASVLALLGFSVSCACYSEYLSQRDYHSFLPLFTSLDVVNYIHYGTFNKMCEGFINQDGDIRKVVEGLISTNANDTMRNTQHNEQRAKFLLIDEVDVFFSKDFYGNLYTPSTNLRDPTITLLLNMIWNGRNSHWTLPKIKATFEYKNCCVKFRNWESLLEEVVKELIFDLTNYQSHDYIVKDDKIGYKEQDNIVFNVSYGYKTLFAYYHELERGNISKRSLEANKCLNIKCGSFSYAEIPLLFNYIMGVTGTLKTLSEAENKIIEKVYSIKKKTFTPSVFGANKLSFRKEADVKIENKDDYHNSITDEIRSRLVGKNPGTQRAVLVFFESQKKLMEYYNSNSLGHLKEGIYVVTEEASPQEKDNIVRHAPKSGQVTLLTRTFGRGTDFVCHDQIVSANGGTHVIQTFLSEELSEEVQIKGRTARQGDFGSYSMILLDESLEKFLITKEDLANVRSRKAVWTRFVTLMTRDKQKNYSCEYDFLNDKREDLFKTQYQDNSDYLKQAKKEHEEAISFLNNIKCGKMNRITDFLLQENKGPEGNCSSRTICLMDATGSMSHLLRNAKNTVGAMFTRACRILLENNIKSDCFEMQFAVYRNYNCREDSILQSSPWETKPDNLRAFMDKIEPEGGMGNEAIEIGLWHANNENDENKISQIILIGDAPANTEEDVEENRASEYGEDYWQETRFSEATYYQNELERLQEDNIPVHAFYVDKRAKNNFNEIANETGGRCEFLDINSPDGAAKLTDLVTEEILRNVGKSRNGNGDELVKAYRMKFGKSYNA